MSCVLGGFSYDFKWWRKGSRSFKNNEKVSQEEEIIKSILDDFRDRSMFMRWPNVQISELISK